MIFLGGEGLGMGCSTPIQKCLGSFVLALFAYKTEF